MPPRACYISYWATTPFEIVNSVPASHPCAPHPISRERSNQLNPWLRLGVALALLIPACLAAQPVDRADLQALRAQVQQLEQQLKVLSRQLELKEEAAAAAAPSTPKVTINDKGYTLASSDAANSIRLRGLVQLDHRLFIDDGAGIVNNAFVLRRARMIAEGTLAKNYGWQLVTEFGGSSVSILDANLFVNLTKNLQLRAGKFKVPVGLELLQSDSWTFLNERSIVTNLVPGRDLGVQLSGELLAGRLNYAVGVFNGVADGATSTNTDFDEDKDVAGRVFATPFKADAGSPLQGLSFGIAGSMGRQKTAAGRPAQYRTDGQQTFFSYNAAVIADGQTWRISPQLDYRNGPFGLIGEYVKSVANLRPTATGQKTEISHTGWQVGAGFVLTGEDSSFNGVVPKTDFNLAAGTWGAFEVVGRYSRVDVDDAVFPAFAAPGASASGNRAVGVGLNWYWSKAAVLKLSVYQNSFDFSPLAPPVATAPVLRQDEQALITRFQFAF
jgi:phosphate-selective porin OprO/OprP